MAVHRGWILDQWSHVVAERDVLFLQRRIESLRSVSFEHTVHVCESICGYAVPDLLDRHRVSRVRPQGA